MNIAATDSPKVAAIILAWEMTSRTTNATEHVYDAEFLRAEFARNYTAIAAAVRIDNNERKSGSSQG